MVCGGAQWKRAQGGSAINMLPGLLAAQPLLAPAKDWPVSCTHKDGHRAPLYLINMKTPTSTGGPIELPVVSCAKFENDFPGPPPASAIDLSILPGWGAKFHGRVKSSVRFLKEKRDPGRVVHACLNLPRGGVARA